MPVGAGIKSKTINLNTVYSNLYGIIPLRERGAHSPNDFPHRDAQHTFRFNELTTMPGAFAPAEVRMPDDIFSLPVGANPIGIRRTDQSDDRDIHCGG